MLYYNIPDISTADNDKARYVSSRDYYAFLRQAGARYYKKINTFSDDVITFEAQDPGVHVRLRFRLENGKFIHEVAVMD